MTLELEIYKREAPTVRADTLPFRMNPAIMEEVRGNGAGRFDISKFDPKLLKDPALLNDKNIVKFRAGGKIVNAFVIQNKDEETVGSGEDSDRIIKCSGEGLRTWFRDAILYPMTGTFQKESGDTRYFSFASEQGQWYNPAQWITPLNVEKWNSQGEHGAFPASWPDVPNAWWIWSTPASPAPLGTSYIRYEFDLASPATVAVFMAADDYAHAFMDAELIIETSGYYETWQKTWSAEVELEAGHHIFAVKMENNQGPARLLAALRLYGDPLNPSAATNISYTGLAGWKILPYPGTEPGWTSGEILLKLLQEAKDRNVTTMLPLVPTFTATTDSNGVAWNDVQPWEFTVGIEYREIIEKLEELGCDIWIDPDTYQLHAVRNRGTDHTVQTPTKDVIQLRVGKNILAAEQSSTADVKNVLAIKTADGWIVQEDGEVATSPFGRVEGTFSTDAGIKLAEKVADVAFSQKAKPEISSTYNFLATSDVLPYQKVFLGDWIYAPDANGQKAKRRIMSISITEDAAGNEIYAAEFDNIFRDETERLQRWLEMISKGRALGGALANSSVTSVTRGSGDFRNAGAGNPGGGGSPGAPVVAPSAPISLAGRVEELWDGTTPYFAADLTWAPVTSNVSGEAITVDSYLIWAKRDRTLAERTVTNGCTNPSFESGVTGVVTTNSTAVQSTDWVKYGTRSLKVSPSAVSTQSYVDLDGGAGGMRSGMVAGQRFTASVTFRMASSMIGSPDANARTIQIVYVNPGGTVVTASQQAANVAGEQTLAVSALIPADATQAFVRLYNGTGTGNARDTYWDGVSVVAGAVPVSYFDGTFSDTSTYDYAWTGAAHASSSRRITTDHRYVIGRTESNSALVGRFASGEKYIFGAMAHVAAGAQSAISAEISLTMPSRTLL